MSVYRISSLLVHVARLRVITTAIRLRMIKPVQQLKAELVWDYFWGHISICQHQKHDMARLSRQNVSDATSTNTMF
jgi:hypothetical protein